MEGKETELDKTIIEAIKDPLTHLVRNCRRPRHRAGRRSRRRRQAAPRAACSCAPITRAARSTSRSPTTAPASTSKRIKQQGGRAQPDHRRAGRAHERARAASNLIFLPGFSTAREGHATSPAAASAWTWSRPTSRRSAAPSTSQSRRGQRHDGPDQDPADAGHHPGADRHQRRRSLRDPAGQPARAGAPRRATQARDRIELIQGAPVYRLRGNLLPLVYLNRELEIRASRAGDRADDDGRQHRRPAGRRPPVRPGRRRGQRHRGDRRQAARQAAEGHHRVRRARRSWATAAWR